MSDLREDDFPEWSRGLIKLIKTRLAGGYVPESRPLLVSSHASKAPLTNEPTMRGRRIRQNAGLPVDLISVSLM